MFCVGQLTHRQTQYWELHPESDLGKSRIISEQNYTADSCTGNMLVDDWTGSSAKVF